MIDVDRAFEINPDGLVIDGAAGYFSGSGVPTFTAPEASLYTRIDVPSIYQRKNSAWELFSPTIKKTITFPLHYVSGTGLNTTMNNGSFFRVSPGITACGSNSGFPSCFPLQPLFICNLKSIELSFRQANFDYNASAGKITFELESRNHTYNGSTVHNRILCSFGNFSGNSTGANTHKYHLELNTSDGEGFNYISGTQNISANQFIGCRFVKTTGGVRAINSFVDVVMKLNYEEV